MGAIASLIASFDGFTKDNWLDGTFANRYADEYSNRLSNVIDLGAGLYVLAQDIGKFSLHVIKMIGSVALTIIIVVPACFAKAFKADALLQMCRNLMERARENGNKLLEVVADVFKSVLPRIVGNGIGIFIPEIGRLARNGANPFHIDEKTLQEFTTKAVDKSQDGISAQRLSPFERWYQSTYILDNNDHECRLICLIDIGSQLFRFVEEIGKLAIMIVFGLGALFVYVVTTPITLAVHCFAKPDSKGDFVVAWREFEQEMRKSISFASFFFYFAAAVGKIAIKAIGNGCGVIIPEMGRYVRTASWLNLEMGNGEPVAPTTDGDDATDTSEK